MNRESKIGIGIIGAGTVGGGVIEVLKVKGSELGINLKKVAVRDLKKHPSKDITYTTDAREIINDPQINIVVELMGGKFPAQNYIFDSLSKHKSVVTANKAVVADHSKLLFEAARNRQVDFAFEASVGGGIQIINLLNRLKSENISSVMGVLNGTTNFILTRMEEGMDFNSALKLAQEKGFAEADHIRDTGGYDSRDKLAILSTLAFNSEIKPENITIKGITEITPTDIDFANNHITENSQRGYAVKLLGIANKTEKGVELSVKPVLISKDHPLASVREEFNAITISGELAGEQTYIGKGAGRKATTSAVVSDIVRLADNLRKGVRDDLPNLNEAIELVNPDEIENSGYIRTSLKHIPLSGAEVLTILGKNGLNVEDSIQSKKFKEKVNGDIFIPDIITIEKAKHGIINKALDEVDKSNRTHGKPLFIPFI